VGNRECRSLTDDNFDDNRDDNCSLNHNPYTAETASSCLVTECDPSFSRSNRQRGDSLEAVNRAGRVNDSRRVTSSL
jgi:hypothetical protein